jgi:hypothetical protein
MNAKALINQLGANADAFRALLESVRQEHASWKPAPDQWSLTEVIAHLLDEEREDFRTRLDLVLHKPEADWPPIDPSGWVTQRDYAARDLQDTLRLFLEERSRSLTWLRALRSPNWESTHTHPVFGSARAGDLLGAWIAHDFLHLRQIARIQWQRVRELARPFVTDYAGDWQETGGEANDAQNG